MNYVNWMKICSSWEQMNEEEKVSSLRENPDDVDWEIITKILFTFYDYEEIVREFENYIIWPAIQTTDLFSKEFVREFEDKLDLKHRKIRKELREEFKKSTNYFF